jgi:nucleoside-diphosphate-sugar epimerase
MKLLFIGGTGNISSAVSRRMLAQGHDLTLLNRGRRSHEFHGAQTITVDINDETAVAAALGATHYDVVVNYIAFSPEDVERDIRLFAGRCGQYVFISSASAYQKPPRTPFITEATPLENPFWEYSRRKAAAEERLLKAYREEGFPVTIVRPSLTYDKLIPAAIGGWSGFTLFDRVRRGLPLIVHGDGTSLWTITHSEDFALGLAGLFGQEKSTGEAFHITSDEVLNWNQIYETIAAAAGEPARVVHIPTDFLVKLSPELEGSLRGDKSDSAIFDNSKIKQFVPEYQAEISFSTGMKRLMEWFAEEPARQVVDETVNQRLDAMIQAYLPALEACQQIER